MTRNNLGQMQSTVLAILGPTASGKSALGLAVAERYHGEIINCDSTAVYRGFDIGTDKLPVSARQGIPHHLIDIADPVDTYSAAKFSKEAQCRRSFSTYFTCTLSMNLCLPFWATRD